MPALHNPWLIAAWPGMGRVAQTAGEYLAAMLDMQHVGDFPADRFFETTDVAIESGVIRPGPRPRCPVFLWKDPQQRHDLVLLLGEAQPQLGGYQLCEQIVEQAKQWHIARVFTFAAMATQMQPGDAARVFGGVSTEPLLEQLTRYGVLPITGGQIGGMNGLMLVAAQQRNIEAVGLLGELPYFATQVPNPRASSVVLHVFARMLDLKLDLAELDEQAEKVDQQLMQLVEQLRRQAEQEEGFEEDE
ncbi:MAG: PAC2 family protein, partial [Phycisphaeraceae bacterium]